MALQFVLKCLFCVLLLLPHGSSHEYHKITIENKTKYRLRVRADSERIIEKRVRSQKSGASKDAFDDSRYQRNNEENSNIQYRNVDDFSNKFNDEHSDTFKHDSGEQSSSDYDAKSSSQHTNVKASGGFGGFHAESDVDHLSDTSSESLRDRYNQHTNIEQNKEDSTRDTTEHRKSGNYKDDRTKNERVRNDQKTVENEANFYSEYSAELEHTFITAGYSIIEPFQSLCLVTSEVMAYVTISAFIPESEKDSNSNKNEIFLWQNQQTIDEYLKIDINKMSNNPQVRNGDVDMTALHTIGLSEFIPKFREFGWTDPLFWNSISDDDLKNKIGFKKGHKLRFDKYKNKTRFDSYQMEWHQFNENIKNELNEIKHQFIEKNKKITG
eukprot:14160_1